MDILVLHFIFSGIQVDGSGRILDRNLYIVIGKLSSLRVKKTGSRRDIEDMAALFLLRSIDN